MGMIDEMQKDSLLSFLPTKIAMDICVSLISHCWTLPREHESWLSWNCRTWNERKQNEWGSRDINNNASSQRLCILGILSVLVLCPESYLLINIDVKENQCYEGNDPMYYEVHINEVNLEQMSVLWENLQILLLTLTNLNVKRIQPQWCRVNFLHNFQTPIINIFWGINVIFKMLGS